MLTARKQARLLESLKKYSKKYLKGKSASELDEPGTRLIVHSFLVEVLGFAPLDEIKTEYMIKGSYADYVIQMSGKRFFLVEVKALALTLDDAHLRPALNFGANEGIDWVLLTNGRIFSLYKILFGKTVELREVFTFDLSNITDVKRSMEFMQCLSREGLREKGLDLLWQKHCALDPVNVAGLLYGATVVNFLRKKLKERFKHRFMEEEIHHAIDSIITSEMVLERVRPLKGKKERVIRISISELAVDKNAEINIPNPMSKPLPVHSN